MTADTKKTVLITGCSAGGNGSCLAKAFALHPGREQFHVFLSLRNPSKADQDLAKLSNVTVIALDVTKNDSIVEAVEVVKMHPASLTGEGKKSKLDVLINNAGLGYHVHVLDYEESSARNVFDVVYWGTLAMTKAFAPLLMEAGKHPGGGIKGQGVLVNVSSIGGFAWIPTMSVYNAAKAAETTLTHVTRLELRPLGVRVVCLQMGGVATQFIDNTGGIQIPDDSLYEPIKEQAEAKLKEIETWLEDPDVFARNVVKDVLRGKSGDIWRGAMAGSFGYWSTWMPRWIMDWLFMSQTADYELVKRK